MQDNTTYSITVKAIRDGKIISTACDPYEYTTDFTGSSDEDGIEFIYPSAISLNITEEEMRVGDYLDLTATLTPSDVSAEVNTITWGSFDESVATVEDGEVYAEGIGATAIYARTENGLQAYCQITVLPDPVVTGGFLNNVERMIVKYGYEDYLNYHVEVQNAKLKNVKLVKVTSKARTTVFTTSYTGKMVADGYFTISAAVDGEFRSLGSEYNFELVATLSDGTQETLDTATVEIGYGIPEPVENVEAYYSGGDIEVTWDNNGDARWFKVIYIDANDAWATPGSIDVRDDEAEEATIPASAIEQYKTYLIYVIAYPTDHVSQFTSHSAPVRVTTVNSSTPAVTARFVGNQKVYAPGETIQIEITYKNVVKVHYHNGDIGYNPNALQTDISSGDIGTFTSNKSGVEVVELEAQSVSGWYMVEINAKNRNEVQASNFYNYTTGSNVACLGLEYYVDASGLDAPTWRTSRSMSTTADLFWSAVSGAIGYRIWVSTTNNINNAEATDLGNVKQYTLNGLITGRTYYVWVQAVGEWGGGAISVVKKLLFSTTNPTISATITNKDNIPAGGQIPINITYNNVMKVHYQNGIGDSGDIWADPSLSDPEKAEFNISGSETVYLPAPYIPGNYEVTIWAKDMGGNQATSKEGLKISYTVTGQAPIPYVSLSLSPSSTGSIVAGASSDQAISLTHTFSKTTKLVYTLHNHNNADSPTYNFTTVDKYATDKSLPYIPFENLTYSEQDQTGEMTFIPSPDLLPGIYTLRVTATNDIIGSIPVEDSLLITISQNGIIKGLQGKVMSESQAKAMVIYSKADEWSTKGKIRYIQQYLVDKNGNSIGSYYYKDYWWADKVRHNCDYGAAYMAVSYLGIDALPKKKLTRSSVQGRQNCMEAVATQQGLSIMTIDTADAFITAYSQYANDTSYKYSPIAVYSAWSNGGTGYHAWTIIGRDSTNDELFWVVDPGYNNPLRRVRLKEVDGTLRVQEMISTLGHVSSYDETLKPVTFYQFSKP